MNQRKDMDVKMQMLKDFKKTDGKSVLDLMKEFTSTQLPNPYQPSFLPLQKPRTAAEIMLAELRNEVNETTGLLKPDEQVTVMVTLSNGIAQILKTAVALDGLLLRLETQNEQAVRQVWLAHHTAVQFAVVVEQVKLEQPRRVLGFAVGTMVSANEQAEDANDE